MPESRTNGPSPRAELPKLALLAATLAILGGIVLLSPGGAIGFMQSVVEDLNVFSISVLAVLIGVVFVLLQRLGVSFSYVEEIGSVNAY